MDNVEFMFHCSAVSTAEAAGQEKQEQRQNRRQPAAPRDAEPDISRSAGQHAVWSPARCDSGQRNAAQ